MVSAKIQAPPAEYQNIKMTDIYIKSFNRPHYLDRCIASVREYVRGNYQITILDDGTPKKYLDKILEKYPEIKIKKSENYEKKTSAVQENLNSGKKINGFQIPTKLWIDAAKDGSDHFIMTEDDVWFTAEVNVDELSEICKKYNTGLVKLGWLGNFYEDKYLDIKPLTKNIVSAKPKGLILKGEKFMEAFFRNRYRLFSVLYKLKIVDNETRQKYWALNSILFGFFEKSYWLKIWSKMDGMVDEKRQLINASVYYKSQKHNPNFILRLKNEAMKTTFQSSATGSYHEYGNGFDVNIFNHILNEAWFQGALDPMENFPKDFSENYILRFLKNNPKTSDWKPWAAKFREQYRMMGCDVE